MAKFSQVFIAEKPSLAKAIADGLGQNQTREKGYILVNGDIAVTNLFGHMLELAKPDMYKPEWKVWDVETLPYAPDDWKLVEKDKAKDQLRIVEYLLKNTSCVINAGDPDREGQMLVDEVIEHFKWSGKTLRVLPNATDLTSIKRALSAIKPNSEFRNLYESAMCRARADWMVGLSLTVAATKLLGTGGIISIGRVQTPTLALVVNRDIEIDNFKSVDFYNLMAEVKIGPTLIELNHVAADENRIYEESIANAIAVAITGKNYPLKVEQKDATENPLLPFSLASLQKEAGAKIGLSASDTLKVAQELYEMKITSYPRTDCSYLPEEQKSDAIPIAKKVMAGGFFKEAASFESLFEPKSYIYDTKKAPVHHGIVPTGIIPNALEGKALKLYELIVKRFILSLMPAYKYKETTVSFLHEGREFKAKGEIPVNMEKSWRALEKPANPPVALPEVQNGSTGHVNKAVVKKGKTTSPKPYTEGDLLTDMSGIAKFVTDERIKSILKENSGIGTPATQASIIETLKARGYVELVKPEKGKNEILKSTQFGREVIAAVPKQLKDPGMTATWEEALKSISEGEYKAEIFMSKIVTFTNKRIEDMKISSVKVTTKPPQQPFKPAASHAQSSPRQATGSSHHSRKAPQSKSGQR